MSLPVELANLPAPTIIEELDYEARLAAFVTVLVAEMAAVGISYDTELLETDPAKVLLEVATYGDLLMRQRINEAIRANLLAFAYEGDLDHLAQFYDVTRLPSETDDALRSRVILAIQGRSTGGTAPRYAFVARSADVRVKDVSIYTVGRDPTVRVALFSTDPGGIASPTLVAIVNTALQDPAVRMVNDVIVVEAAVQTTVNVSAKIWLLPSTPPEFVDELETILAAEWKLAAILGFDLTKSWLTKTLMQPGVHRVEILTPSADVAIPFNQAAALGTITLAFEGVGF